MMRSSTLFRRALAAELVRTRHTAGTRIWLAGLAICVVQALGWWTVATQELRTWRQLLAWQTGYLTGMAAPLAALIGGLTVRREKLARSGGTRWRAVPRASIQLARVLVLTPQLLIFNLSITVPMALFGLPAGLSDPPVGRLLLLAIAVWVGSLPVLVGALLLAERIGLYVAVGLSVPWQVAGTILSSSSNWWLQPWTWAVRPGLPLLRIRANGVAAGPNDPELSFSIWQPMLLAAVLAAVLVLLLMVSPEPRASVRRRSSSRQPPARPSAPVVGAPVRSAGGPAPQPIGLRRRQVLSAALTSSRRTPLLMSVPGLLIMLVLVAVIWNPGYVRGTFGVVLVPIGACVAGCIVTTAQAPALRVVLTRVSARRWCGGLLAVLAAAWLPVVVCAAILGGRSHLVAVLIVGITVGIALVTVNLWLAARFGPGAAIGVTVVGIVLSLIFGVSELADSGLWLLGPWAWAYSATSGARMLVVVPTSVAIAVASWWLWLQSTQRTARS